MPQFPLPLSETVTPASSEELAAAVGAAAAAGTPVFPPGGGTRLSLGAMPKRSGVGLSLAALNRLVDYPCRDLTVTVQAGMTVAQLRDTLAAQRQRLPVDVPAADRATVGGIVAAHAAGPRRLACGTIRDYVLGLTAVDGSGTVFSTGGRVVKNAAGYDLWKLLVGSLGTLGVITQVTLMVRPLPEASALTAFEVSDWKQAEERLEWLNRSALRPTAIELLAGPAWRDVPELGPQAPAAAGRLVVGFEGPQAEVAWMIEQIAARWGRAGHAPAVLQAAAAEPLWSRLTDFVLGGAAEGAAAPLVLEIFGLPVHVNGLLRTLVQLAPQVSLQAHAGSGVLRAVLPVADPRHARGLLDGQIRPAVAAAGARLVVAAWPPEWALGPGDVWGDPPAGLAVMQRIKRQFDPRNILNPGRYVFDDATLA